MPNPKCVYCGTAEGLRQYHDGGGFTDPEYTCEACFTPRDDGPCFDDLPPIPAPDHKRRIADYAANVERQRNLVRKTRGE